MEQALKEMEVETAQLKIRKVLNLRIPRNTDLILHQGDKVKVFRESDKKYIGLYPVVRVDGKQVFIIDENSKEKQFCIHQVIKHEAYEKTLDGNSAMDILHNCFSQFRSDLSRKRRVKYRSLITEILHPADPRCDSAEARASKKKEIDQLISLNNWKVVLKSEMPENANILPKRFAMSIKDKETEEPYYKSRFVVQGHRDREKSSSCITLLLSIQHPHGS